MLKNLLKLNKAIIFEFIKKNFKKYFFKRILKGLICISIMCFIFGRYMKSPSSAHSVFVIDVVIFICSVMSIVIYIFIEMFCVIKKVEYLKVRKYNKLFSTTLVTVLVMLSLLKTLIKFCLIILSSTTS